MTREAIKTLHGFIALGGAGTVMDVSHEGLDGFPIWPDSKTIRELVTAGFLKGLARTRTDSKTWSVLPAGFKFADENPL